MRIRELFRKNREFCDFEGYETRFRSKKPLCSSHFSSNSLHKLTGKIF